MLLKGKKVVIVGGSSGIGLATAEMAKHEGADVIIASRNVAKLDAVAEKLNVVAIPADVTSDQSVVDLFRRSGPVDHVVVTAAQLKTGPFKTVSMDDVRATMESKFWGAWRVARAADIRAGGSLTLVSGSSAFGRGRTRHRRRGQWRTGRCRARWRWSFAGASTRCRPA
jgi:NAD(P)-dependent dehydrogenase (short-subunit alcohol dehydrogenase family)